MEKATELEFLKWFFSYADFGPAESDVRAYMYNLFENHRPRTIPDLRHLLGIPSLQGGEDVKKFEGRCPSF